jgi:hypothetical protein
MQKQQTFAFPGLVGRWLLIAAWVVPSVTMGPALAWPETASRAIPVIAAASCAQTDVQAAIDAAGDGDFVLVPAGHCTWTTPSTQMPSVTLYHKALTLQGAGIDQTVITDGTGSNWNEVLLRIDGVEGKRVRVTGLGIIGQGSGYSDSNPLLSIYGTSKNFRVDHIKFDNVAGRSIGVFGYT